MDQIIEIETDFGIVKFHCPPGKNPIKRAKTLLSKEPETIEWINSFDKNDILWDVGANVGCYSLYAALKNIRVLSFEPMAANYYLLNKNIEINKMDDRILSFCIAFSNSVKLDYFYLNSSNFGDALHTFGEEKNWLGEEFTAKFKQGMIGYSIDNFIEQFKPEFPTHIKIDVDGIEDKIISGATQTLIDDRLKSVLIEINTKIESNQEIIKIFENFNFKLYSQTPTGNRKIKVCANCIFIRNGE